MVRIGDESTKTGSIDPEEDLKGLSLKERLEEGDRRFLETGRYWGLEHLELKESNPLQYEILFGSVRGALVACRETAKNISASPIVEEIEEVCFNLYTPEGEAVAISTGIITHVQTMSEAIKWMLRNDYEVSPGIRPGDVFQNNDSDISNVHTPDVQTFVPIFAEGALVAWAAACVHVMDIGATVPGSIPVGPINRFGDGMYFSCEKVGENDQLFKYYDGRVARSTRTPTLWALDDRMRLSACNLLRARMLELIDEVGLDTFKRFVREAVEDSRRGFLARTRQRLIPGEYEDVSFSDIPFAGETQLPLQAQYDDILHLPVKLKVQGDGKLLIDYRESSPAGLHTLNGSPEATIGGYFCLVSQTLTPGEKINSGQYLGSDHVFQPGSILDPQNPHMAHGYAWYSFAATLTGLMRAFSRGYYSRGFREEVFTYTFTYNMMQGGGIDHYGAVSAMFNFDFACTGMGAQAFRDGVLAGHAMWNPLVDMGEVETWELLEPLLYLSRRVRPMTGGAGKYRGGNGLESLRMMYRTNDYVLQFIGPGLVFDSMGLFGGYPASVGYAKRAHRTNMRQLTREGKDYPLGDPDPRHPEIDRLISGEVITQPKGLTTPEPFQDGDLYLNIIRGGPGYGDALERDPAAVLTDVEAGEILEEYASVLYGVVISTDGSGRRAVDDAGTRKLRGEKRQARLQRGIPVAEWVATEAQRVKAQQMPLAVKRMYNECIKTSASFAKRFRAAWNLDDDFVFDGVPQVVMAY